MSCFLSSVGVFFDLSVLDSVGSRGLAVVWRSAINTAPSYHETSFFVAQCCFYCACVLVEGCLHILLYSVDAIARAPRSSRVPVCRFIV